MSEAWAYRSMTSFSWAGIRPHLSEKLGEGRWDTWGAQYISIIIIRTSRPWRIRDMDSSDLSADGRREWNQSFQRHRSEPEQVRRRDNKDNNKCCCLHKKPFQSKAYDLRNSQYK